MADTAASDAHGTDEPDFRAIVDGVPSLIFTFHADGTTEFVNRAVLDYFGLSLDELRAWRGSGNIFHPEEIEAVAAYWAAAIASRKPYTYEHRLRRADGEYRWFQLRAVPSFDAGGRLLRWYGNLTDIDDLRRAQDRLRTEEQHLKEMIDNIPGLVFTMTPSCEIEHVNARVTGYFGKSLEELRDWDRAAVVHPDDVPAAYAAVARTIEFEEPYAPKQRLRAADGTFRWFQTRSLPLRDESGRIVRWYGLLFDVDDLTRAEHELQSLQSRLERATQLATLSQLAASIAHEVNQPLTAVVANGHACCRWLAATPPNLDRALLCAERIVRDGNSAAQVIERTRALFRSAPAQQRRLDLNDVIREVSALFAHEVRSRSVDLALDLQDDLPPVLADRVHMQQVVANLTRNALEALEAVDHGRRRLVIASSAAPGEVTISVEDSGPGIAAPDRIFEPFCTTKENGLGVGLSICRSILEAHDGRLWADSSAHGGAALRFSLPCGAMGSDLSTDAPAN